MTSNDAADAWNETKSTYMAVLLIPNRIPISIHIRKLPSSARSPIIPVLLHGDFVPQLPDLVVLLCDPAKNLKRRILIEEHWLATIRPLAQDMLRKIR